MGLFDFVGNALSGTVKVAITPLAVVKDIVDGEPLETTADNLESAGEDFEEAFDSLFD